HLVTVPSPLLWALDEPQMAWQLPMVGTPRRNRDPGKAVSVPVVASTLHFLALHRCIGTPVAVVGCDVKLHFVTRDFARNNQGYRLALPIRCDFHGDRVAIQFAL